LLGGHGRDYSDFKASKWQEWQQPIIDEYNKLRDLGYKKINLIGASTGCPLILNAVNSNQINSDVLQNIFFIDPIILPSNKTLSLVSAVGPALSYDAVELDAGENGFWYKYRPYQALEELNNLTQLVRKDIEKGITLPSSVKMKIYKSNRDGSADPASAPILLKGVKHSDGSEIGIEIINSSLHVFTRLKGRNTITTEDQNLQQSTFEDIKKSL
jgi:carboxylesterase